MRPRTLRLLPLAALFLGVAPWPPIDGAATPVNPPRIAVPPGFSLDLVASGLDGPQGLGLGDAGLDGPQGLGLGDAGRIAVCETIDSLVDPRFVAPSRLTLVRPDGRKRVLATREGPLWIDVARDPARGYFVTTIGGFTSPPTAPTRGIRRVLPNGEVSTFLAASDHLTGIALDRWTGDLYIARVSPNPTSIDRVTPSGVRSVFVADVRPEGLAVALGRRLIASLQRRPSVGPATALDQIVEFRLDTGAETVLATNVGILVGGVAVSARGDIYVSDHKDGKIRRLRRDAAGHLRLSVFASGFSTSSRRYPKGVPPHFGLSFNHLVFGADGRLVISDYGAGRLYAIRGPF